MLTLTLLAQYELKLILTRYRIVVNLDIYNVQMVVSVEDMAVAPAESAEITSSLSEMSPPAMRGTLEILESMVIILYIPPGRTS